MPHNPFNADHRKVTQIINFFASKSGGKINKLKALKLIFLADRYHLRKYGRLVSGDYYVAMKLGPVPSTAMDIAELDKYLDDTYKTYAKKYIKALDKGLRVESIRQVDVDYFSESDMEALNFAWNKFGHLQKWSLSDFTHFYPEWKKHEDALRSGSKVENMELEDFFLDPDVDTVDKCYELTEEERRLRLKHLAELIHCESLWR